MPEPSDVLRRKLQYRLNRQGMLELDIWLTPLLTALKNNDERVLKAAVLLLNYELPVLLDMLSGKIDIPKELQAWLKKVL